MQAGAWNPIPATAVAYRQQQITLISKLTVWLSSAGLESSQHFLVQRQPVYTETGNRNIDPDCTLYQEYSPIVAGCRRANPIMSDLTLSDTFACVTWTAYDSHDYQTPREIRLSQLPALLREPGFFAKYEIVYRKM